MKRTTVYIVCALSLILLGGTARGGKAELKGGQVSSKTFRTMARVYIAYGEYEKAQSLMEQALASARKANASDHELAMCLIDTACLYKKQNKLTSAEKMCTQGLKFQKKALSENHPYIAYTLRILASIYRQQGKLNKAGSALDNATNIMRNFHADDDYAMVSLEMDTAKLHMAQGNLAKAESQYAHALSAINKNSPNHFSKATVLEDMAKLYFLQGRYTEAGPLIDQALSMKEKVYGQGNHLLVPALFIKAGIEWEKKNYSASEKFIRRALAVAKATKNITTIVKVQRRAEEIRAGNFSENEVVAKAVP